MRRFFGGIALAAWALAGTAVAQTTNPAPLPFDPDQATRAWLNTMDAAATARSNAYFEGGYWIQFVAPLIGFVIAFLALHFGVAKNFRTWLEKSVKIYFFVVVLFVIAYSFVGSVVQFPWDYWTGFVREHDYHLATQNFGQWFGEYLLQNGISLALSALAIGLLYLIIAVTKKTWWIWGTLGALIFAAILQIAYPVYLAPQFNTFTPMAESPLKQSVLHLAQANGVPADNVYVFDLSRQTHGVSANVSGFAGTTRISLADNLINRETPGGVRAVLGHEIGHYALNHTASLMLMNAALTIIVFALANFLFTRLSAGQRWGIRDVADPAGMPLLFSVIGFVFLIATPIQNNITRFHEQQADIFGLNAAREPDGFAESAVLLSEYRKMAPSPLEEWFFYDHPSGFDRVHMAMVWKAHHMALGDYPLGPGGPPPGWRPDFVVMHQTPTSAPSGAASPAAPSNSAGHP